MHCHIVSAILYIEKVAIGRHLEVRGGGRKEWGKEESRKGRKDGRKKGERKKEIHISVYFYACVHFCIYDYVLG